MSSFSFWEIEGFLAVCDELHFGRAAERLHISQPSLTRQIQRIELDVGVTLIDRRSKRVTLTPAGAMFYKRAQQLLRLRDSALEHTREVAAGVRGELVVGLTASAALAAVPELIRASKRVSPELELRFTEHVSLSQEALLRDEKLHIALLRRLDDETGLVKREVFSERLIAAVPQAHPLADPNTELRTTSLAGNSVITYSADRARYFADLTRGILANIHCKRKHQATQISSVCALVSAGAGVGIVPESTGRTLLHPRVVYRDFLDLPEPIVKLYAVYPEQNSHPVTESLLSAAFGSD